MLEIYWRSAPSMHSAATSLPQDYLNVRGQVSATGLRGANRRCDCDGYRPDTLWGGIWGDLFLLRLLLNL
jgi:hypothetical protein